jgi:hypothetical protein
MASELAHFLVGIVELTGLQYRQPYKVATPIQDFIVIGNILIAFFLKPVAFSL